MFAQFTSDFPCFVQIFGQIRSDVFHAFFIGAFARTFAVAERRPVVRVLVHQQAA